MIECATERHSKSLLNMKLLCNISINVTPHTTLNSSKGVVRSKDHSEEEICEKVLHQSREFVPTNTLILTFSTPTLPDSVKADYLRILVVPVTVLQMSNV